MNKCSNKQTNDSENTTKMSGMVTYLIQITWDFEPMYVCSVCMLEKDPGPCQASFYRWYFNSQTGRCEEFTYGGCLGNGNRFLSKSQCEETCDRLLIKEPVGRNCSS